MTDLLLYFALCLLAAIVVCAALFWLTRPEKVETLETTKSSFAVDDSPLHYEFKKTVYMVADRPYKPLGWKTAKDLIDEDTRPMSPTIEDKSIGDFDTLELWGEYNETVDRARKIDKWERQAFEDAGEDFEL